MWSNLRLLTYIVALGLNAMAAAGIGTFDAEAGIFTISVANLAAILASGLAAVALYMGWGRKG